VEAEKIRIWDRCRACGSRRLDSVLNLGKQFLTGFPRPGDTVRSAPLELLLCNDCHLVQLRHSVPPAWLYTWYGYRSSINQSMRTTLQNLADEIDARVGLRAGDVVVDVGSNDGFFLRSFKSPVYRVGFEPAENLRAEGRQGLDVFIPDFFNIDAAIHLRGRVGPARVITAIAMFYDLDDPVKFLQSISHLLADDGVLVIQMNYLGAMLKNTTVDNISHEHVCYYSLFSLWPILRAAGFVATDVEENDVNGGSFRIWCAKEDGGREANKGWMRTIDMLRREAAMGFEKASTYREFGEKSESISCVLREYLATMVAKGKKVYVYGASTRGLVLMQFCGIDNSLIEGAAERNAEKWGRFYSGTGIPCVPEDEARAKADAFLVLPYQFIDEFVEREREFLDGGGELIVPLPEPRVIDRAGTRFLRDEIARVDV
jgi:SAM-dependent methyltransferase